MKKSVVIVILVVIGLFLSMPVSAQKKKDRFEPKKPSEYIMFALDAMDHDSSYAEALEYIDEAIALDDSNAFAFSVRGSIYLFQERYASALMDFDKSIALDSTDFFNYFGRAKCWYYLGNNPAALTDLNLAVSREPFVAEVYLWRSKIKKILGDTAGSEADLKTYQRMI